MIGSISGVFVSSTYFEAIKYGTGCYWLVWPGLLLILSASLILILKKMVPENLLMLVVAFCIGLVIGSAFGMLINFFPGWCSGNPQKMQSDAYWKSEANPFAIPSHMQTGSNLTLFIRNVETVQNSIENINIAGMDINASVAPAGANFAANESKPITINLANSKCTQGETYYYSVNITYVKTGSTEQKTEVGAKSIYGKCG